MTKTAFALLSFLVFSAFAACGAQEGPPIRLDAPTPSAEQPAPGTLAPLPLEEAPDAVSQPMKPGRLKTLAPPRPAASPPSRYWLGVLCSDIGPALRAHIDLPEETGILVERIVPDGPVADSDLLRHDIIVKAEGEPVGAVAGLVAAVEASGGEAITLEILRRGKTRSVEVTPQERPAHAMLPNGGATGPLQHGRRLLLPGDNERLPSGDFDLDLRPEQIDRLMKQIEEQLRSLDGHRMPFQLHMFRPGVIVPESVDKVQSAMSRSVVVLNSADGTFQIEIERQGDQPAKIRVQRDDEVYEATEDSLDALPEDVREDVERLLNAEPQTSVLPTIRLDAPDARTPSAVRPRLQFNVVPRLRDPSADGGRLLPGERDWKEMQRRFQERIDRLERQMDEFRIRLEETPEQ